VIDPGGDPDLDGTMKHMKLHEKPPRLCAENS